MFGRSAGPENRKRRRKPAPAALAPALGQRYSHTRARIEPGRRIAKALANVVAPVLARRARPRRAQPCFADGGRFPQGALGSAGEFALQQPRKFGALGVSEPRPDKMEDFVNGKKAELRRIFQKARVENDSPLPDEADGIDLRATARSARDQLAAMRGQVTAEGGKNREPAQARQPHRSTAPFANAQPAAWPGCPEPEPGEP